METGFDKTYRLFKFLQELYNNRNPSPLLLGQYTWVYRLDLLPLHSDIKFVGYSGADSDYVLSVGRPSVKPPPAPPDILKDWISSNIADPSQEPTFLKFRNLERPAGVIQVAFADDENRVKSWQNWLPRWHAWADAERPDRQALKVFEDLYALKGRLDREGDHIELVLGDGILSWQNNDTKVFHPVLLQKVQLEFDANKPEFRILEADTPPEFYGPVVRVVSESQNAEAQIRSKLESKSYHLLAPELKEFYIYLANFLSAKGQFIGDAFPKAGSDIPVIGRAATLFLRPRNQGFSKAIEGVLRVLPERINTLEPLQRVVGVESKHVTSDDSSPGKISLNTWDVQDVLLSKPANREQLLLVKNLKKHPGVVVQGPPGTGKTHTIANLIGHLLAEGKSVLVTAHTSKALRVLRDKVSPELQPLCVSVLDSDQESRKQLEDSVAFITQKLGEGAEKLEQEARTLEQTRHRRLEELAQKRQLLIEALGGEYREVVALGRGFAPSEAARLVRQYQEQGIDWIPGRILKDSPMPVSIDELAEIYESNAKLAPDDEAELRSGLPNLEGLPKPLLIEVWIKLTQDSVALGVERAGLWLREPSLDQLEALSKTLEQLLIPLQQAETWQYSAIMAGSDPQLSLSWIELIKEINTVQKLYSEALELSIRHAPSLPADMPLPEQADLAREIADFLKNGGGLNVVNLAFRSKWKAFIQKARVNSDKPFTLEHFRALEIKARLLVGRQQLLRRWKALVTTAGGMQLDSVEPERMAGQFIPILEESLKWYPDHFYRFQHRLAEAGFEFTNLMRLQPPNPASNGELLRIKGALEQLSAILEAKKVQIRQALCERQINRALSTLDQKRNRISAALFQSLDQRSPSNYSEAYKELQRLWGLLPLWQRRISLLERMRQLAPEWAQAIASRKGQHGSSVVPKEPENAWLCRLLSQELDARSATSINDLQTQIANAEKELHQVTADLIERKAWASQIRKTNLKQRQALVGWLFTVKKIGKGAGKRVPRLRAEAARLMADCRSAVPVWIMPLARVIEQFNPEHEFFDVVIVDEASQTDLFGLILFAMARKIIVVGDKEQVSPLAVGENIEAVGLLHQQLEGIPNAALYDGKRSIYDIASESFGGQVMLREHFRSVPEIIQFSNVLCYGGKINPLRESSHSFLKPSVRAVRVNGYRKGKSNPVEAREIVDIIKRCIADPLYTGKTIGVISMVGEEQALLIEQMLREEIPPSELANRRLLCGNPAQFQGDERDVMFLSLVDVSDGVPLPLRDAELWRQRFNVAASRARDQMWVVYSLDPAVDLKPNDLRRLLIEHALHPERSLDQIKVEGAKAESPFEREILEHLTHAGYRVRAQWPVGSYRIDLVVEGGGKRVAVECDGDRYHPPEKWPEDIERQRVLERLGWQFIRIRGSSYYRDRISTLEWLVKELDKLGVTPESSLESPSPASQVTEASTLHTEVEPFWAKHAWEDGDHLPSPTSPDSDVISPAMPQTALPSGPSSNNPSTDSEPVDSYDFSNDNQVSQPKDLTLLDPSKKADKKSSPSFQQDEIHPEDQVKIKQILATNPELWFELAHWAKERGHFMGWERKFIFSLGVFVKKGRISYKQARHAVRLLVQARQLGFSSSKDSL